MIEIHAVSRIQSVAPYIVKLSLIRGSDYLVIFRGRLILNTESSPKTLTHAAHLKVNQPSNKLSLV